MFLQLVIRNTKYDLLALILASKLALKIKIKRELREDS